MSKVFEVPLYPYQRSADQDAKEALRHPVVVVGAGPIGLAAAIDLAQQDVPVLVLDDNDKVSWGSRAVCYAKRPLRSWIVWAAVTGSFLMRWCGTRARFSSASGRFISSICNPKMVTSGQHSSICNSIISSFIWSSGCVSSKRREKPVELRGRNKVTSVAARDDGVTLNVETPDGSYTLEAEWLIACDGAASPIRTMMGARFRRPRVRGQLPDRRCHHGGRLSHRKVVLV